MRPRPNLINSQSTDDTEVNDHREQIFQRLTENGATMIFPSIAGRGIIKVVGRCEDAKENNNLGKV